ncbi:MMPL family transporter [Rhodoblastus acidophilus]|uniref:MMPL family transporter n=1 Tax=Candidatus Rhodoblastus alkanivorans TaxID=2954117 RepID=A0ABS9Z9P7_9HYPH|nr:MMPL family transporter [Candidatus Rhodoblastus alkanivorans]MCI4678920.1 MMPL family transporter [Candidatus Rhodoblastus alkanivorans]MCI4684156.1 MMPL family transporter [Candidatus Rhodoblastus alkanivorans]MDI4641477.1 MMPL family transporter [Rhodoblastus acidophilus]
MADAEETFHPEAEVIGIVARTVAFSAAHKFTVLALALLVTALAGWFAADHFAISTDLNKLINPHLPWRQREIALGDAFPQRANALLVVLDARSPELATDGALKLEAALKAEPRYFADVSSMETSEFFRRNGLLYLPAKEVQAKTDQLIDAQPFLGALARDPSLRGFAGALGLMARGGAESAGLAKPLESITGAIDDAVRGKASDFSWSALFSGAPPTVRDKRRFIMVKPVLDFSALEPGAEASDALRAVARRIGLTPESGYRVRLTGDVAMQDEEFGTLAEGAVLSNSLTVIAVLFILWRALRWRRLILAVMLNMFMGLAITAAVGLAMVGSLNPISVAFAVLFVGIGVDFGIQFCVRYREERYRDNDLRRALNSAGAKASLPLALAAAATAAGFYSFIPTDYRGVSELGLVAGTGMIIAFLTSITALPALLALLRPRAETKTVGYSFLAPLDEFQMRHRRGIIAFALGLAVLGAPLLLKVRFDYNPLHLRSVKTESVSTLLDVMQDPHMTPNIIEILKPSLKAANALAVKLRALPTVESVTTLSDFVPEDQKAKLAMIADARSLLGPSLDPVNPPPPPTDAEDARALSDAGAALQKAAEGKPALASLARAGAALERLGQGPESARARARALLIQPMKSLLDDVRLSLQAGPVTLADLPTELRRDWIAADGRARMEVAPRGDKNDYERMRPFVNAVLKIAPDASGAPVGILASGDTVLRAFAEAGALAFASIALLLYIALRRIGDVALTLAPLLLAGVYTMEICALIGLKLNFANIIALPLLLGLGVAFKIYYVIAWRAGSAKLLRTGLTRAIFFSAMTTATAFGSLWLSNHPGTSSMGKLLALSLATTLCAAILFQPALMGPPRVSKENEP